MTQPKTPNSRRNLDLAIDRLCAKTGDEPGRVKRLLATAIVGQMLPDGAAKGGNALKIRFGKDSTRFSRDLDTARASSLDEYVSRLEDALAQGWCGFTGTVAPKEPPSPEGVPAAYVMQPFEVKLSYNGKSWMTLPLEVGHNEIGDADDPDMVSSPEAAAILAQLGFPEPGPVPCMRLEHQISPEAARGQQPGQRASARPDRPADSRRRRQRRLRKDPRGVRQALRLPPRAGLATFYRQRRGMGRAVRLAGQGPRRPADCRRCRRVGERPRGQDRRI